MTSDFNYKKYSLENLENWMHDVMSSGGATPQEIYDVIKSVVEDNYHTYKHQTSQAYELLALLNGNGKGHISCYGDDSSGECQKSWNSFWVENYYPEENKQYTDEELNAMCDKAEADQKHSEYYYDHTRNDPNRPNPFDKEKGRTLTHEEAISVGWEMTADGFWIPPQKEDKVVKWLLPVQQAYAIDSDGEYFVNFPDDLLEAANLKEGDQIEWVNNGDGSYTLRKVTEPLNMDEC